MVFCQGRSLAVFPTFQKIIPWGGSGLNFQIGLVTFSGIILISLSFSVLSETDELFHQTLSTAFPLFSAHRLCWLFPLCLDTCSSPSCHNSNCVLATVPLLQSLDGNTHHPPCLHSFLPLLSLGKCHAVTGYSFPPLGCSSHHSTGSPGAASKTQPWHRLKDILLLEGTPGMWGCITHGHSHCWWLLSWSHLFLDAPWCTSFFEASSISSWVVFHSSISTQYPSVNSTPMSSVTIHTLMQSTSPSPVLNHAQDIMWIHHGHLTLKTSHLNSQPSLQIWFVSATFRLHKWYHPLSEPETWKSFLTLPSPCAVRSRSLSGISNPASHEWKLVLFSRPTPKDWRQMSVVYCWEDW